MKKLFLILLISIINLSSIAQIIFEPGYFINNKGEKTDCLIKNVEWKNNPSEIHYKLTHDSDFRTESIESISEFGIINATKYVRFKVNIDRSSEDLNKLSNNPNPEFNEEILFLNPLVEGKANLYSYVDGNLKRFFYSVNGPQVKQLIFKSFIDKKYGQNIGENNKYRQQLWNEVKCHNLSMSSYEYIDYTKKELLDYFLAYNECSNSEVVNWSKPISKTQFQLTIRPGLNIASTIVHSTSYTILQEYRNIDFGYNTGYRIGLELEYTLPFNKNKWAITIEPTFQSLNAFIELDTQNAKLDYKSIEIPIGIRHYFFLNENSKMFVNGAYVFDYELDSQLIFGNSTQLDLTTRSTFNLGLGYKYKNKYSLEMRLSTNRNLFRRYFYWYSEHNNYSIVFGYNLF